MKQGIVDIMKKKANKRTTIMRENNVCKLLERISKQTQRVQSVHPHSERLVLSLRNNIDKLRSALKASDLSIDVYFDNNRHLSVSAQWED